MKLHELIPDDRNANRGTRRGADAVEVSLRDLGAGRSVLIDRDGRVIAGNKTVAAAKRAGIENVLVVQTTGDQLIAVQRVDLSLDDPAGRKLAVADNRAAELGLEWDPAVLAELSSDLDLKPFFTDSELSSVIAPTVEPEPGSGSGEVDVDSFEFAHTCPKCGFGFNDK